MPPLYYFAAWTDSGCLCGCDHQHLTIAAAVVCTLSAGAGSYVIAVESGQYRELNPKEEGEFQELMYGKPTEKQQMVFVSYPKTETA